MSEQEKKQQRIYDLFNAEAKLKFLCLPYTKLREIFLQKKTFLRKIGCEGLNKQTKKKRKEGFFLIALTPVI